VFFRVLLKLSQATECGKSGRFTRGQSSRWHVLDRGMSGERVSERLRSDGWTAGESSDTQKSCRHRCPALLSTVGCSVHHLKLSATTSSHKSTLSFIQQRWACERRVFACITICSDALHGLWTFSRKLTLRQLAIRLDDPRGKSAPPGNILASNIPRCSSKSEWNRLHICRES
jgi:hypothetical protein